MENYRADERLMRLERALLARGLSSVAMDAAGEADLDALRAQLARLGFEYRGCEQRGYTYDAEFRRPPRHQGERALHGAGTAYSEHNAVIEAAIAALEAGFVRRDDDRPGSPMMPAPLERWRRLRPWKRAARGTPTVGS
jgi:hypothetical protein